MSERTEQSAARHVTRVVTAIFAIAIVLNSVSAVVSLENNAARIHQLQAERVESILRACRDTNQRHDRTIRSLDELIQRLPSAKRTRAVQSRAGTVLLINALAPHRDCETLARANVPSG